MTTPEYKFGTWYDISSAPKDGSVIELRCVSGEIKRARWGTWDYCKSQDTWWCSDTAGWTLSRRYAPDAWRPHSAHSPASMTISNESGSTDVSLKSDTSLPPQSIEGE
jgi:hypothetical protein